MNTQDTETESDPYLCRCAACRAFWSSTFAGSFGILGDTVDGRSAATSSIKKNRFSVKIGDRVLVGGTDPGVVKYVGYKNNSRISPMLFVGVKLDNNVHSLKDGQSHGKSYFHCERGHGVLVRLDQITPLPPYSRKQPLSNNTMFPSYEGIKARRKLRSDSLTQIYPSKTPTKQQACVVSDDKKDIAHLDLLRKERHRQAAENQKSSQVPDDTTNKISVKIDPKIIAKFHEQYGDNAETLIKTLQKLHLAYEEGKELLAENGEI